MADTLSPEHETLLADELAIHERVKIAVRAEALAEGPDMEAIKERLIEIRDEAITASERDLPSLFQALYTQHSLAARNYEKKLPDMRAPYFAHMRLIENGKARDVLIGYQTFIDSNAGITIIDWRHAQLAKVFFNFREGDEYEVELPGRIAHGTLVMRRVIAFDTGELVGVTGPEFTLQRQRGGPWAIYKGPSVAKLEGGSGTAVNVGSFGLAAGKRRLPDVSALLDPEQYEILNREDAGALLILGGAGSGKTTIALHRLAQLAYQRPKFYRQRDMQVVVPEQGLVRLTERLLRGLGMDDVRVETFDAWVADQARNILKGVPKRLCDFTPPAAIQIKRHPAMMAVVDEFVASLSARIADRARFLFDDRKPIVDTFATADEPLMARFEKLGDSLLAAYRPTKDGDPHAWRRDNLTTFMRDTHAEILNVELARSELYINPELHRVVIANGEGVLDERMIAELVRHTKKQFEERSLGHLDEDEMEGKKAIDESEIEEDDFAGTIDVEDYAVLLYLMLKIHGRVMRKTKALSQYRHLVVDEAQDLAPVELKVLGRAVYPDTTMTIAGDAAQQSDPTVVFRGWDDVLDQLGAESIDEARLNTNYRCPRPVAAFGQKVLGPLAIHEAPKSVRDGAEVSFSVYPNEGVAVVQMTEALTALFENEPQAAVAVICENEPAARAYFDGLRNAGDVRLVIDGEFTFKPGIDVTDVSQVKGLEFDYVVIPDANYSSYPDTPVARRTLHIAVTRAVHQLWVISVGRPSEII